MSERMVWYGLDCGNCFGRSCDNCDRKRHMIYPWGRVVYRIWQDFKFIWEIGIDLKHWRFKDVSTKCDIIFLSENELKTS
jgi:hypothetical protein